MVKNGKALRFAALIRVSTEKQEKKGESLRTQATQIKDAVQFLHSEITHWYGGQEHGTPGHEKKEVDRLIRDATKGIFDAVIVSHLDRWSRDNQKSAQGLDVFQDHGIRYFAGGMEYLLSDPQQRMMVEQSAVMGQFFAANQNKKSIENRIHRARRGLPTAGKLPFGRTFDPTRELWGIDIEKKSMIEEVAKRYLKGESLAHLASEFGVNHSSLHKNLSERCGTVWTLKFSQPKFNISEEVEITIPALLPEKTIRAIKARIASNKTYFHGAQKYHYLLGSVVFCDHCGYALMGQANAQTRLYYRHAHTKRDRPCPRAKGWIKASELEDNVLRHLFECFGNPDAVQRAINDATPNLDEINDLRAQAQRIESSLNTIKLGRDKMLRLMTKGALSEEEAEAELARLKEQEIKQAQRLQVLYDQVDNVPTPQAVRDAAKGIASRFRVGARRRALIRHANTAYAEMTWDEKRSLVRAVFDGLNPDGTRMGIYITWLAGNDRPRKWRYAIRGRMNEEMLRPYTPSERAEYFSDETLVANSVCH